MLARFIAVLRSIGQSTNPIFEAGDNAMSQGDPKDEYRDLSDNMRQYGNLRFAQLTLFIASTAALLNATLTPGLPFTTELRFLLKIGGVITAIVFWVMEERAADYWHHFRRRAVELEKQLGYQQYTTRPARTFITATNAARLFYASLLVFWVITII
jgi:hypothetical protein